MCVSSPISHSSLKAVLCLAKALPSCPYFPSWAARWPRMTLVLRLELGLMAELGLSWAQEQVRDHISAFSHEVPHKLLGVPVKLTIQRKCSISKRTHMLHCQTQIRSVVSPMNICWCFDFSVRNILQNKTNVSWRPLQLQRFGLSCPRIVDLWMPHASIIYLSQFTNTLRRRLSRIYLCRTVLPGFYN